ncbi:hypothetical protein H1R20_g6203, partial [Candolleomyces eurysporus]
MSQHRLHVVGTRRDHARRFKGDISTLLTSVLKSEPGLSPQEAMWKVEQEMLQDNPFLPPKNGACIINTLPVELLAHIFRVGVDMQRNGGGDDEFAEVEEGDEKKGLEAEFKRLRDEDTDSSDDDERGVDENLPVEDDDDDPDWEDEEEDGSGSEETEDEDDEDDGDEDMTDEDSEGDEDEEQDVPFELLVSRVCKHWRETAINTPDLWTALYIEGPHQWDRYEVYLERAKAQSLDLEINISPVDDEDSEDEKTGQNAHEYSDEHLPARLEVKKIMDLVVPKASQWHHLVITTTTWRDSRIVLQRLHEIPAAPSLESFEFQLYDDEEPDDYDVFAPQDLREPFYLPFQGNAPNLQHVNLWSVHIDWDGAVSMFKNLNELELGYHAKDVRPSWRAFSSYLKNSPQLARLELKLSGPSLPDPSSLMQPPATPATGLPSAYYTAVPTLGEDNSEGDPNEWPRYPLELPSVHDLILSDHDPEYAYALATKLHFPNLRLLSLNYYDGDFTRVVEAYSQPLRGVTSRRSVFQTIEAFDLVNLGFVTEEALGSMLHSLNGLKHITLDVDEDASVPSNIWTAINESTTAVYRSVRAKKGKEPQHKSPTTPTNPGPATSATDSSPTTTTTSSSQPTLTIIPPEPQAPLPGLVASADLAGAASGGGGAPVDLSTIHPQLLLPNLEGMRTREIPTIELRRFLKRRIKIGAPIKQLAMHRDDNVTKDDQRWLSDHLEEFDFYSDSEEDDDDDSGVDFSDEDAADLTDQGWTDEDEGNEDEDDWEDEGDDDDDAGGDDDEGGRVRTRRGPTTRGGAASTHVTTGLANLD